MAIAGPENEARQRLEREVRGIPAPELPAYAAKLLKNTPAAQRSQTPALAFETISKVRPAAASSVAAAISKAAPLKPGFRWLGVRIAGRMIGTMAGMGITGQMTATGTETATDADLAEARQMIGTAN